MIMSRRHFIRKLIGAFTGIATICLVPLKLFSAIADDSAETTHYKPLNGRRLKDIACQKLHHGSDGFTNPLGQERHGRFWKVLRWKLFHKNRFKGDFATERVTSVSIDWDPIQQHHGLSITYLKHAGLMIKDENRYLMVDPVFHDIFWFIKDFTPMEFDLNSMPAPDHVLITHGHYDHLDEPSLGIFDNKTHVITPLGYDQIFDDLKMQNRTQLDWFDTYGDGKRQIMLLPCNHWTMRNPFSGPNRSLWGSYLIQTASGHTIYVSGDTAYFDGFAQLGKEFDIDLAVFNLGAYEPRWFMKPSHINPRETVRAFKELNAGQLMVIHWGTFRLGDEPVYLPPVQIKQELEKEGLLDRLVDLEHGHTLFLNSKSKHIDFRNGLVVSN
jgi:L-ascorbate metabolism protein UlaG (beta-lactamase superfamily)